MTSDDIIITNSTGQNGVQSILLYCLSEIVILAFWNDCKIFTDNLINTAHTIVKGSLPEGLTSPNRTSASACPPD